MPRLSSRLFAFLAALVTLLLAPPAFAEKRIALVIGNSAYQGGGLSPLRNPVNDARLTAETLKRVGFSVTLLTDADEMGMKSAIRDLGTSLDAAGKDAVGLFYYSGHGVQVDGQNYVIPTDSRTYSTRDIPLSGIRLDLVEARMTGRINFILVDACRGNSLASWRGGNDGGLASPNTRRSGIVYSFSTAPGEFALDGDGLNSPYSLALAKWLPAPNLSYELMLKRVAQEVSAATGGLQKPFFQDGLTEDFCFGGCGVAPQATTTAKSGLLPVPRIALLIGNAQYDGKVFQPLANPVNDVKLMKTKLEALGFEVIKVENANADSMNKAIAEFGSRLADAGPRAVGLFYFAGHGVHAEYDYMIPSNFYGLREIDVQTGAPRIGSVEEVMRSADNGLNFIVFDACRSNKLIKSKRTNDEFTPTKVKGILIAYSTSEYKPAADGDGKNSPYATAFSRMIFEPIPVESLFRRVAGAVSKETKGEQSPVYESYLQGDEDFCFAGCRS